MCVCVCVCVRQVEAVLDVAWGGVSMLNALLASAEVCVCVCVCVCAHPALSCAEQT